MPPYCASAQNLMILPWTLSDLTSAEFLWYQWASVAMCIHFRDLEGGHKHLWLGQAKPSCNGWEMWSWLCSSIHSSPLLKYRTFKWPTWKHATTSQLSIPGDPQAPLSKDKSARSIGRWDHSSPGKRGDDSYPPSYAKKAVWRFLCWDLGQRTRIQSRYPFTPMQACSFVDLLTPLNSLNAASLRQKASWVISFRCSFVPRSTQKLVSTC